MEKNKMNLNLWEINEFNKKIKKQEEKIADSDKNQIIDNANKRLEELKEELKEIEVKRIQNDDQLTAQDWLKKEFLEKEIQRNQDTLSNATAEIEDDKQKLLDLRVEKGHILSDLDIKESKVKIKIDNMKKAWKKAADLKNENMKKMRTLNKDSEEYKALEEENVKHRETMKKNVLTSPKGMKLQKELEDIKAMKEILKSGAILEGLKEPKKATKKTAPKTTESEKKAPEKEEKTETGTAKEETTIEKTTTETATEVGTTTEEGKTETATEEVKTTEERKTETATGEGTTTEKGKTETVTEVGKTTEEGKTETATGEGKTTEKTTAETGTSKEETEKVSFWSKFREWFKGNVIDRIKGIFSEQKMLPEGKEAEVKIDSANVEKFRTYKSKDEPERIDYVEKAEKVMEDMPIVDSIINQNLRKFIPKVKVDEQKALKSVLNEKVVDQEEQQR